MSAPEAVKPGEFLPEKLTADLSTSFREELAEMQVWAKTMMAAGLVSGPKSVAQALIFQQAGREMGLAHWESLDAFDIIEGKLAIKANTRAAQVKRSGKYKYRIVKWDDTGCWVDWFELVEDKWEPLAQSSFTAEEATKAGLAGKDNYRKWGKDMFMRRAIARGQRAHCPEVTGGIAYYDREEILDMDPETGEPEPGSLQSLKDRVAVKMGKEKEPAVMDAEFKEPGEESPVDMIGKDDKGKPAVARKAATKKAAPAPAEAPVEPAPSPEPEAPSEPHNDIAEAQAKRKAEDDAQAQKNYEENIGKFNATQEAIRTGDPNRVAMPTGEIIESLDGFLTYYGLTDARLLYLKRLSNSQPGLTIQDFVNLFEFLKKTKGDAVAAINEAHTSRVGTWQALCEHFKYTPPQVVVEEEPDGDRNLEPDFEAIRFDLEPIVAEEGFAPVVLEWLVENRADASELVDYIVHLRAQGVDVAARLASHAESNLSMEQAHEEDGFDG